MANHPCPDCGSSDALELYEDGHTYCFSCKVNTPAPKAPLKPSGGGGSVSKKKMPLIPWEDLEDLELPERKLKQKPLDKYAYKLGKYNGHPVHVANYYWQGHAIAQHIRGANKKFFWVGNPQKLELFGQRLCGRASSLVITEGEIDTLSVSQAFGSAQLFDVVSVPSGAQSAAKYITLNLEFVERYESVILCFDNDEPGKDAIKDVTKIISAGKIKIVCFPSDVKDASDLLQAGRSSELKQLIFSAAPYRPDGVIAANSVALNEVRTPISAGVPYDFPELQARTFGARQREITLWTAGSGIGKSTALREISYDYRRTKGQRVGMVFLEENKVKTVQGFIALDNNIPLANLRYNPDLINREQYTDSYNRLIKPDGLFLYDHFGSLDSANLISKLKFMVVALKVQWIFLDHISIVVSGNKTSDERKDIDILMTSLRTLCESTGVGIHAVVHLKRDSKSDFNTGSSISLKDLRGSASLEQLSDNVIALERDQQAEGIARNQTKIRLLKCRETGDTGVCDTLAYNRDTGRLLADDSGGSACGFKDESGDNEKATKEVAPDDF